MSKPRQGVALPALTESGRDDKAELFLLAVHGLTARDQFPETAGDGFAERAARVALDDDGWLCGLIDWTAERDDGLRSVALVAAVELVRARLAAGLFTSGGNRQVISGVLRRADEPGRMLGYWFRRYGRSVPKPVKRGIADAVRDLYDERAMIVHDGGAVIAHDGRGGGVRFADVLKMTHPAPANAAQADLFRHILLSRRRSAVDVPASLPTLGAQAALYRLPQEERARVLRGPGALDVLERAAMTWDRIAGWLGRPLDADAWAAVLPLMGYRDRLRALRAFDEAGLDDHTAATVAAGLADEDLAARAGVLPLEILAAARATRSRRWDGALERAAGTALNRVPALPGRTLILVDRSASMFTQVTRDSSVTVADQAAAFGAAIALRAEHADLVQFGTAHTRVPFRRGEGPAEVAARFREMGDGNAAAVVDACYRGHDRVAVITDEPDGSAWDAGSPVDALPAAVPSYIWNVASTAGPPSPAPRHVFAGLTDAAFEAIPLIEARSWR
ncbi:TROVE domain-containing protein [Actinomadura sp. 1N219]|uniref:TROVE domain-containing protein n=1 Tax=Actinomadura sp. 1N219 TaxID=3375152 RepID=UPI0037AD2B79